MTCHTVLFWPMTPHCRSCLRTVESCIVTSYHRTDNCSIFNTLRSFMSFSHNLTTFETFSSTCKTIMWSIACLNDCNIYTCLMSMHAPLEQPSQVYQHPILTVETCSVNRSVVSMVSYEVQILCCIVRSSSVESSFPTTFSS